MPRAACRLGFARALFAGAALLIVSAAVAQQPETAEPVAADGDARIVDVQVGFDRHYKLGCWTPVRVVVASGLARGDASKTALLRLETTDGDGTEYVTASEPMQLTPGMPTTATIYVRFGSRLPAMTLTLLSADGATLLTEKLESGDDARPGFAAPMSADERLVVCLGRSTALDDVVGRTGVAELVAAKLSNVGDLPTRAIGYDGVDAVLLSADRLDRYSNLTAAGSQTAALVDWLQSGGRLTIVAGNDAGLIFALPAFQRLAAIQVAEPVTLPRTDRLESFAGNDKTIANVPVAERLRVPRATGEFGVVDLREGDLPLIARRAVGLGILTISFVDLEHPQLKGWRGRGAVLARAMRLGPMRDAASDRPEFAINRSYGYGDLSGQLRSALDRYEGVAVVSFMVLAILILLYILLIGPLDFLLVKRVFRRTELTWFTFPAIVVATSLGAYFAAVWMKGDRLRVSQVDVVDCDVATGKVRGTTFAGIFSPKSESYDVRIEPPAKLLSAGLAQSRTTTSWLGLSGDGFGGMQSRTGGGSWFSSPYQVSPDLGSLSGVPIQVWSSKMFLGRWDARGTFTTAATSEFGPLRQLADGSLAGAVRSPIAVPLEGAMLCYGTNAYHLGTLEAGKSHDASRLDARLLASELQKAEVVAATKSSLSPSMRTRPHDPGSQQVEEIVRKMMFYEAAGGREHARLKNQYHGFLDLSELLKLNRAVLVGTVAATAEAGSALDLASGGSPVSRDEDRRRVFVRIVLPVEPAVRN